MNSNYWFSIAELTIKLIFKEDGLNNLSLLPSFSPFEMCIRDRVSGLAVGIMWPGSISLTSARIPNGGTALFALLALAGDAGGTFGPSLVGLCTHFTGDDIHGGILAATFFPALLVVCLLILRRKSARL